MSIVDDKRKALRALGLLKIGLSAPASVAAAAADERVEIDPATDEAAVLRSVRTVRFLVVHERDYRLHHGLIEGAPTKRHPLLTDTPEDVIVVPLGHSPEDEALRDKLMAALGTGYSSHTGLYVWQDAIPTVDEDGNPASIPAKWRSVPLRDRSEWAWLDDDAPADRRSDAKAWARRRAMPPAPEDA